MEQETLVSRQAFKFAAEKYNPRKGWDSIAQPEITAGFTLTDFIDLSPQLLPNLQRKVDRFIAQNELRAIHVSQQVWHAEFEMGSMRFREWLKDYCARTGQSPQADILIVDACAKSRNSAERKMLTDVGESTSGNPAYGKDYIRSMGIVLQNGSRKKSLDRLSGLILALETSQETLAYNNQYVKKHKLMAYRGYHAIWNTGELVDEMYDDAGLGLSINAEFKLEHEAEQELNRMTRTFQGRMRAGLMATFQDDYYRACGLKEGGVIATKFLSRSNQLLIETGKMVSDYLHAQNGFDRFLDKDIYAEYRAPTAEEVSQQINKIAMGDKVTHADPLIRNVIALSGLDLPKVKLPTFVPFSIGPDTF